MRDCQTQDKGSEEGMAVHAQVVALFEMGMKLGARPHVSPGHFVSVSPAEDAWVSRVKMARHVEIICHIIEVSSNLHHLKEPSTIQASNFQSPPTCQFFPYGSCVGHSPRSKHSNDHIIHTHISAFNDTSRIRARVSRMEAKAEINKRETQESPTTATMDEMESTSMV